ncbi:MAG: hypothetical protein WD768_19670, partial [Phycisphaeraceae bacterium]
RANDDENDIYRKAVALPASERPPEIYYLKVDDRKVPVELRTPINVKLFEGAKTIVLHVEPYRVFKYGPISFRFPREYSWRTTDQNPLGPTWQIEGPKVGIMVTCYKDTEEHDELRRAIIDRIIDAYRTSGKVTEKKLSANLGETKLEGIELRIEMGTVHLRQEIYSIKAGKDSFVFLIQAVDGEQPSEGRKMLFDTFKIAKE